MLCQLPPCYLLNLLISPKRYVMAQNSRLYDQGEFINTKVHLVLEGEVRKQQKTIQIDRSVHHPNKSVSSRSVDSKARPIARTEIRVLGSVGFGQTVEDNDKYDLANLLPSVPIQDRPKMSYSAIVDSMIALLIQIERLDLLGMASGISGGLDRFIKYWTNTSKKAVKLNLDGSSRTFVFPTQ